MRSLFLLFICTLLGGITFAQEKVKITDGPVDAITRIDQLPTYSFNDGKLFLKEMLYLQNGDWLTVQAKSRDKRLFILLYDLQKKEYLKVSDDSLYNSGSWQCFLSFTSPRTDSFSLIIAAKESDYEYDEWVREKIDTPHISYTIAKYHSSYPAPNSGWNFTARLSYLCNHWTAGFRAMPRQENPQSKINGKPAYEYIPVTPVTLHDSMGASVMKLAYNHHQSYFQYSGAMPYQKARELYKQLQEQLKKATDKEEITNFNAPNQFRRKLELEASMYFIRVPKDKVPVEYFFLKSAGEGFLYIPVSLFLFGDKTDAKVLVVMGENGDDIYDIGI